MDFNPYSPPRSDVGTESRNKVRWHANALLVFLLVWGAWWWLMSLPPLVLGEFTFAACLPLGIPFLILASACLLYVKSRWMLVTLALLAPAFVLLAIDSFPELLDPFGRSVDWSYVGLLPLYFRINVLLSVACFIYALFLKKWGYIE